MDPGCANVEEMAAVNDCEALLPQVLLAFTVIAPPAVPAVAEIEFVVDAPVQPDGKVQV